MIDNGNRCRNFIQKIALIYLRGQEFVNFPVRSLPMRLQNIMAAIFVYTKLGVGNQLQEQLAVLERNRLVKKESFQLRVIRYIFRGLRGLYRPTAAVPDGEGPGRPSCSDWLGYGGDSRRRCQQRPG